MRRPAFALAALALLCAPALPAQTPGGDCDNCGTVQTVRQGTESAAGWRPLGTVTPGSISGDVGQTGRAATQLSIGRGGANEGFVVLGAAGGAAYEKRPQAYARPRWDIVVAMDRGGEVRTIPTSYDPLVQPGDRVRVYGTQIEVVNR